MTGTTAEGRIYDVAIIGAGVVGCAVFRACVLAGARTVLLEKGGDLLEGASKANSAILHTGFDATPDTLEAACVQRGYALYREICESMNLSVLKTGAMVVAWTDEDLARFPAIMDKASRNGVPVRVLDAQQARQREPALSDDVRGAVLVEGEDLIDPWTAPMAYARQAIANGGELMRKAHVEGGTRQGDVWRLDVAGEPAVSARVVINCAGNYGDLVEAIARPSPFTITPRKGQFVVFDKTAYELFRTIILPVPTALTKGVVVTRTVFGNVLVGPTAEPQDAREFPTVDHDHLTKLREAAFRIIPALSEHDVTTTYAGLRPATQFSDYQIEALDGQGWITVGGIRSTGLTGALGIAEHVVGLYRAHFADPAPLTDVVVPHMPNLVEDLPRPWMQEGRGPIACHCERVTEREIEAALTDAVLPAGTLGGLRRRTRCMMGRCQGFYCTRRVIELARTHLPGLVSPIGEGRHDA
ncbi:NAD(P)/FAD-dependent oxidoreductase [Acetobacter estunensis]|uniref:NAD(P)/FAD-dependent oxidoreductase n=1 Tax=Acetobacter estunensis TaxID=104097 RepID=UPI001C2DE860|nr:NAD(P)/FAD-dependent oxidoreductase [Acetobacter estunensis]MBV1836873.1 NAD(P)/FAD-dependent oxidoreductase [Acetobacter estunensis]